MNFLSESEEAIWSFVVLLPRKKTFKDGTKLTQVIQPKLHLMTIHFPITWLLDRISLYAPCWQTQETSKRLRSCALVSGGMAGY
jgi:hypothetical protein